MVYADLKQYFGGFDIVGVRWLDGSSCNVQMKDEFAAKNALFKRCAVEAQEAAREVGLEQFGLNWLEAIPFKKKKNDDYGAKGSKAAMYIRLATVQDVTHKAMDRPLVQSSTLTGLALATSSSTFGDLSEGGGGGGGGGVDKEALAKAGAASWNQLMSTHSQNKKNRRTKKKRAKGGQGSAASRGAEDAAMRDAEYDRYDGQ